MGPHPEAPVDVQKYIGSCLIAQQPRSKRKSGPSRERYRGPPGTGGYLGNYVWTGVPLISVARQKGQHPRPGQRKVSDPRQEPQVGETDLEDILPISRLAIHAQGAPLILSAKDGDDDAFKNREFYQRQRRGGHVYVMVAPEDSGSVHRTPGYPRGEETEGDLVLPPRNSCSPSQSDCVSTTSEDSGTSENGLPRIIKPRKRRKKDRRGPDDKDEALGGIVTLQPYQPLCYSYSKSPTGLSPFATPKIRDVVPTRRRQYVYPYPPSNRCRCPYCVPPPSTFLTPPDSPVEISENGLSMAVVRGRSRPPRNPFGVSPSREEFAFVGVSDEEMFPLGLEEAFLRSQQSNNTLVLTSSHPPQRPWICMTDHDPKLSSCTFTVMCYNILCDKYATRQMYGYCPNWALDWTYRKTSIMQEILHYKADIISLQEVETEQFYKFFLPELKKDGYDGIFSPKSRAKTMSESERKHVDGCAIFYKSSKFFLLKEHLMEFNQLAMANAEGSDDMLNRVMTKDNIGLAALLQTRIGAYHPGADLSQGNQTLLVCTAHIHWDPEYSDVKLIQTMMLMHELKTFVDDILNKCNIPAVQKSDPNSIPLLLCGDFNSLPDSGVIEYLSSGRVSSRHCDFKEIVYKDCLSKLGNSEKTNEFTHPFKISRAYNDGIMPFTNYSYDFKGVIDYVFYSRLHMTVLGVLGPVDSMWLDMNRVQGCPHPHVPSDHFPIVVELQLSPTLPIHPTPPNGISLHR